MKQIFYDKYSDKSRKEIKQEFISEVNILLHRYYGENPDKKICKRVNQELATILKTNLFLDIAVLQEICDWIHKSGYSYWLSGTTSSSFILYLLGIANINPLPAHSICPKCHSIIWHNNIKDGFDLPTDVCSCIKDNDTMEVDGHDISWENLLMFDDKTPNLQIRIPYLLKDQLLEHLEQNWLISLNNKVSLTFPYKNNPNIFRLSNITFTAVNITKAIYKADPVIISNSVYSKTAIKYWKDIIAHPHITISNIAPPKSFADVIYLNGLLLSSGTWDEETRLMINNLNYPLSSMIAFSDDIYSYMIEHGFDSSNAWAAADSISSGFGLPFFREEMVNTNDRWILQRLGRINYLFPKAHIVEYTIFKLKELLNN